jgi:uncharacterized RmlC-like cupin family protein
MAEVRVIPPAERDDSTAQTFGLQRFEAVSSKLTGAKELWMGLSILPADGWTGCPPSWRLRDGALRAPRSRPLWIGDKLDRPCEAHPGDFVFIPPNVIHWRRTPATPNRSR